MDLLLQDKCNIKDKMKIERDSLAPKKTRIIFMDDDGNILHEETNKVVISGSQFMVTKIFGINKVVSFPEYNADLGIDNPTTVPENEPICCLFACGTSGCGLEASQVYPVNYTGRINPVDLVPFRYEPVENDLSAAQRNIYFGRKVIDDRAAYYYKAFDSEPQLHIQYEDGTQIDSDIYNSTTTQNAMVYVETRLKITKSDFRDWFIQGEGLENCRINTVSLLTAWYHTGEDTYKYYRDVFPLTQLNFSNEWLIDLTKGINIVYQIFY